jgi:hypothetical protein
LSARVYSLPSLQAARLAEAVIDSGLTILLVEQSDIAPTRLYGLTLIEDDGVNAPRSASPSAQKRLAGPPRR